MEDKLLLLDGAMGTMLQAAGLKPGEHPEVFGLRHPEVVEEIHRRYLRAGSGVLYTNTFGASRYKLAGTGVSVEQAVSAGIAAARRAAEGKALVALDLGPIGELLEPLGTLSQEEAYEIYREQVLAGAAAGADLIVLETFTDLADVRTALLAAKENAALPVWVTMSFEATGRTFTGTTVASMAAVLTGLGADALGINCSLGPEEILPLLREMARWTDLPLIVKPNAGLPDPATGEYTLTPERFARQMEAYLELGVMAMGGCCGTTPDFIRALAPLREMPRGKRAPAVCRGVCSPGRMVPFGGLRVVGERLNPTGKKRFQQALRERDLGYLQRVALEQEDCGADLLDLNVGLPGEDEAALMTWAVKGVQSVTSLPLQIDSSDPRAVEAGLRACTGRAIINSVNGDEKTQEAILPLAKKYGAAVVGLTMDRRGIPRTAEDRFAIARRILAAAERHGIPREDLLIDCLTLTVSAQQEQAAETLRAVRMVRERLGLHCTLGVSNISFGLPERIQVSERFLTQAVACGLDFPIINPNQTRMMDAVAACRVLSGEDRDCERYVRRFAAGRQEPEAERKSAMTIETAVARGLKEETRELAKALLETEDELSVINRHLIPALDAVGADYEKQVLFLPQLINAAGAACAAFDLIKERIAARGAPSVSKGKIILATVQGDIHDIGKNIVKVILENYGYQILDLGRDVPVETVVETALAEGVSLVGLSALMTTTVPAMARTIRALHDAGWAGKVWVGGAVLTPEYAAEIGADYYARDARESVEIARKVLGA